MYNSRDVRRIGIVKMGITSLLAFMMLLALGLFCKVVLRGLATHAVFDVLMSISLGLLIHYSRRVLEDHGFDSDRALRLAFMHCAVLAVTVIAIVYLL